MLNALETESEPYIFTVSMAMRRNRLDKTKRSEHCANNNDKCVKL